MPPDHPFPAAINDVVTVYKHLLKSREPHTMIIGGTSAGGGLALTSVHKFKQINLPAPAAIFAGTAWADLTKTSDTLYTNEGLDRIIVTYDGEVEAMAKLYASGHDLKDPLISPVYGNFGGFPPVMLVTGTRDMFLSDAVRTHRKLRAAGVIADLHVYEGMSHADYLMVTNSPESLDMYRELGEFVRRHLSQ
jgi:acetyl esterase/lipase